MRIYKNFKESNNVTLYNGDCRKLLKRLPDESVDLVVTSPPYCIGKAYEDPHDDIETFKKQHQDIFSDLYRVVKPGGSICWQIGYHVSDKCVVPLDYIVYDIFTSMSEGLDSTFGSLLELFRIFYRWIYIVRRISVPQNKILIHGL